MRFIDEVEIRVISGSGGRGSASLHREKFVPYGGPDGGDGGRGGDVVLVATTGVNTLYQLRSRPFWRATDGEPGSGCQCTGASGQDLEVPVPLGTRVYEEESGALLADLTEAGARFIAAKGGAGGLGNTHFKSPTNRTPREFTPGRPGEDRRLRLELRLMADVGLLGFPNAGKSTFIARVSAARPKIADYPFTTLTPNLGVVERGVEGTFVIADIPGLIPGAAQGAGLGHQFLRHLLRTRLLLHLVSLSALDAGPPAAPAARYRALREELLAFDPALAALPEIVVLTKADLADEARVAEVSAALRAAAPGRPLHVVSAATGLGIERLLGEVWRDLRRLEAQAPAAP